MLSHSITRITGSLAVVAIIFGGCSPTPAPDVGPDSGAPDSAADLGAQEDAPPAAVDMVAADTAIDPRLMAWVYERDPLTTPNAKKVALTGVADDVGGVLTSAEGPSGIRRFKVVSCVDEGRIVGGRRICTLKQRANADRDGSFAYDDYQGGGAADDDIAAEVMIYYHAQRAYDFVTDPRVGLFDDLPSRHTIDGKTVPITLVANYRQPAPASSSGLQRYGVAAYYPVEFGRTGLFAMDGLEGIDGDVMYFAQGEFADFGYSGEAVYHEFGHLVFTALTDTYVNIFPDSYGMCHLHCAVSEGIAETFAWLLSGSPDLGAYCDTESQGKGDYLRDAAGDALFPRDISGMFLPDGQVISSANYDVYQLLQTEAISDYQFVKLVMETLIRLAPHKGKTDFKVYADEFLAALKASPYGTYATAVKEVFEKRGLYGERAKDISAYDGTDGRTQSLMINGTSEMYGGEFLLMDLDGVPTNVSPGYIQTYVDVPPGSTEVTIDALAFPDPPFGVTSMDLRVFVRKGEPIHYHVDSNPVQVDRDMVVEASMEQLATPYGPMDLAVWRLGQLTPGTRYYVHFVNLGVASGALGAIKVSM